MKRHLRISLQQLALDIERVENEMISYSDLELVARLEVPAREFRIAYRKEIGDQ